MVKQSIKFNLKFTPSKKDISFNNGQCTKSYSSHKWKQSTFSKMEYLEIFLQLMRRNRQYIPKRNLLSRHINIFPVQYPVQEVSHFGCSSCNKVPLFCWHFGPWWISNITFQYVDNVIIHHLVIQTIIPMKNKSSIEMLVNIICEVFGDQLLIRFLFQAILIKGWYMIFEVIYDKRPNWIDIIASC